MVKNCPIVSRIYSTIALCNNCSRWAENVRSGAFQQSTARFVLSSFVPFGLCSRSGFTAQLVQAASQRQDMILFDLPELLSMREAG